jgi:hypothetical protein
MTRTIAAAFIAIVLAGCFTQPAAQTQNVSPDAADRSNSLDAVAPDAAAVGLAEVTELREVDGRPADGDLMVVAELRYLQSSGDVPDTLHIVKAHGGLRPPSARSVEPPLPGPLHADSLVKGRRYWFAFSSQYEYASGKYPQHVIGFWDEEANESHVLAAAVRERRFDWDPQYDPNTGLTHRHRSSPEQKEWTVRVHRGDRLLWEKTIQGVKSDRYRAWGFIPARQWEAPPGEADEPFLLAESAQTLAAENEFGLPAGEYYVKHAYAASSGRKGATWVSTYQDGYAERAFRVYDEVTNGRKSP